jgi:hypothetical protein
MIHDWKMGIRTGSAYMPSFQGPNLLVKNLVGSCPALRHPPPIIAPLEGPSRPLTGLKLDELNVQLHAQYDRITARMWQVASRSPMWSSGGTFTALNAWSERLSDDVKSRFSPSGTQAKNCHNYYYSSSS